MSDASGGLVDPDGLDIAAIARWIAEHGDARAAIPDAEQVGPADVLEVPCEIAHPGGARAPDHRRERRPRCTAELVVEAANGPTTPEAETILRERGILVVPDVLANAGGVTVSYFEWVQDQQRYSWDELDVQERLRRQLRAAFGRVIDAADRLGCDWRMAALSVAIERVVRGRAAARHLPVARVAARNDRARETCAACDVLLATAALAARRAARRPGRRRLAANVELLHGTVRAVGARRRAARPPSCARARPARPHAAQLPHRPRAAGARLARAALGEGRRRRSDDDYKDLGALKGNRGNQQYRDPRQRRPAPLPQRDLLVRAVHADARAGEPHARREPRAPKLLAPPLVVAHARRRAVVLVGRRRAGLLEHDRARRPVVRRLQRDLRARRQGPARAAAVGARDVPRVLGRGGLRASTGRRSATPSSTSRS